MNVITALISPVLGIIRLHLCWSQTVLSQISLQDRSQAALTITNELTPDPASHQQHSQMCTTQCTQYSAATVHKHPMKTLHVQYACVHCLLAWKLQMHTNHHR